VVTFAGTGAGAGAAAGAGGALAGLVVAAGCGDPQLSPTAAARKILHSSLRVMRRSVCDAS
jgi:hypothetical protein